MKLGILQRLTQTISLLAINSSLIFLKTRQVYGGIEKKICLPVLQCHACPASRFTCPIGALQSFFAHKQPFYKDIPWYIIGILTFFMLIIGRAPCGWLCPFGLFQDIIAKITKKKIEIPKFLNYIKYLVLIVLVIILPLTLHQNWFSRLCPVGTLTAGLPWLVLQPPFPGQLGILFYIKIAILISVIILSIFVSRFFCRVLCPLGAILGLFNKFSLIKIQVSDNCTQCGTCKKSCPMGLDPEKEFSSPECIRCMRCTWCKHLDIKIGPPLKETPKIKNYQENIL